MTQIKLIDSKTLRSWIEKDAVLLVDVREPFEYKNSHIEKAINIPLSELLVGLSKLQQALKDKKLVLQCKAGIRSMTGCELIAKEEFVEYLWNLEGGIYDWQNSGFAVVESKR